MRQRRIEAYTDENSFELISQCFSLLVFLFVSERTLFLRGCAYIFFEIYSLNAITKLYWENCMHDILGLLHSNDRCGKNTHALYLFYYFKPYYTWKMCKPNRRKDINGLKVCGKLFIPNIYRLLPSCKHFTLEFIWLLSFFLLIKW